MSTKANCEKYQMVFLSTQLLNSMETIKQEIICNTQITIVLKHYLNDKEGKCFGSISENPFKRW